MSLWSGLALAKIAERRANLRIGLLDEAAKGARAEGAAADSIGQVDQHGEAAMLLQDAIRHRYRGREAGEIAMRVEQACGRLGRGSVEADNDLRPKLLDKRLQLRLQDPN